MHQVAGLSFSARRSGIWKGPRGDFCGWHRQPYFSTDSAAALRASEIGAEVLLKATKVDGIYTADPNLDPNATRYDKVTYEDALHKRLKVMDSAAFALCMDNRIPIVVFDFTTKTRDGSSAAKPSARWWRHDAAQLGQERRRWIRWMMYCWTPSTRWKARSRC
jgi:hypothetical protein